MADVDYPSQLKGCIVSTKDTSQSAGFIESDPAAGASYTQAFTDNQPTFISTDFRFTRNEGAFFDSWAANNAIFTQGVFFNFPVTDEYGETVDQEARFISAGVPTMAQNGLVINRSGCQLIIPDYIKPDPDAVYSFFDVYGFFDKDALSALDVGMNSLWPA
jgi:hypothetical protein